MIIKGVACKRIPDTECALIACLLVAGSSTLRLKQGRTSSCPLCGPLQSPVWHCRGSCQSSHCSSRPRWLRMRMHPQATGRPLSPRCQSDATLFRRLSGLCCRLLFPPECSYLRSDALVAAKPRREYGGAGGSSVPEKVGRYCSVGDI